MGHQTPVTMPAALSHSPQPWLHALPPCRPPWPPLPRAFSAMQVRQLLAGSPLLDKAETILKAAETTWQELQPLVLEAEKVWG